MLAGALGWFAVAAAQPTDQAAPAAGVEAPPEPSVPTPRRPILYTVVDPMLHASEVVHATLLAPVEHPPEPAGTVEIAAFGGIQGWPLGAVNETLEQNDYEPASDVIGTFGFLVGGGGRRFRGTLLFGGGGADVRERDGVRGRVSYFMMLGQVGYYVYRDTVLGISPLLGVGFGPATISAETRDPERIPVLRGQVDELDEGFNATAPFLMLELGLGAQTVIPLFSETGENGISVMVQAGYALAPVHADWRVDGGGSGYNGPRADVGGPFARLAIGWGADNIERHIAIEPVASCRATGCELVCDEGFASCDQDPRNGCETPIGTDVNCDGCGDRCDVDHGKGACVGGSCRVLSCAPSFANCNGVVDDGCEADLRVEPRHCGACGAACPEAVSCIAGHCATPESTSPAP